MENEFYGVDEILGGKRLQRTDLKKRDEKRK